MQLNYLPNIKGPEDIRSLSENELHELCEELRAHTINTITEIGGHLAPTLGVIELTVALHYVYNTPEDKLIWDVGHQGYCLLYTSPSPRDRQKSRMPSSA